MVLKHFALSCFLLSFSFSVLGNDGEAEALQCLMLHNKLISSTNKLNIEEKFNFALEFLTIYGSKQQSRELTLNRDEFIANPVESEAYLSLLLTKWTEECVKDAPPSNKTK
jgi:hypothetical protein